MESLLAESGPPRAASCASLLYARSPRTHHVTNSNLAAAPCSPPVNHRWRTIVSTIFRDFSTRYRCRVGVTVDDARMADGRGRGVGQASDDNWSRKYGMRFYIAAREFARMDGGVMAGTSLSPDCERAFAPTFALSTYPAWSYSLRYYYNYIAYLRNNRKLIRNTRHSCTFGNVTRYGRRGDDDIEINTSSGL